MSTPAMLLTQQLANAQPIQSTLLANATAVLN
jgi:hypothetical protein